MSAAILPDDPALFGRNWLWWWLDVGALLLVFFIGHVPTYGAAGSRPQHTMTACHMSANPAYRGALDASLGAGQLRGCCHGSQQCECAKTCDHDGCLIS